MTGNAPRRVLRFRPLPGAIVVALLALLCWLGTWQLQRAGEKRELIAAFEAGGTALPWRAVGDEREPYARVWLEGRYESERQVLLDGMTSEGRAGYHVVTPFRRDDGGLVAVNRGWRQWDGPRDALPALPAPEGRLRIEGRASPFFEPGMRLAGGNEAESPTWPRLAVYPSAAELSRWLGEEVDERMFLLGPEAEGGYLRAWRPGQIPPSRHVGYAVQWYALALALAVLFVIASLETRED